MGSTGAVGVAAAVPGGRERADIGKKSRCKVAVNSTKRKIKNDYFKSNMRHINSSQIKRNNPHIRLIWAILSLDFSILFADGTLATHQRCDRKFDPDCDTDRQHQFITFASIQCVNLHCIFFLYLLVFCFSFSALTPLFLRPSLNNRSLHSLSHSPSSNILNSQL